MNILQNQISRIITKPIYIVLIFVTNFFLNGCESYKIFNTLATDEEMTHKYLLEYDDTLMTQKLLFEKSMLWITKSWKDTYSIIDYKDKEAGQIIINGCIKYGVVKARYFDNYNLFYVYEYYPISFKMLLLTRLARIIIEFVQIYPVENFENGSWISMEAFYKSKILHNNAKIKFDEFIREFDKNIKNDDF